MPLCNTLLHEVYKINFLMCDKFVQRHPSEQGLCPLCSYNVNRTGNGVEMGRRKRRKRERDVERATNSLLTELAGTEGFDAYTKSSRGCLKEFIFVC